MSPLTDIYLVTDPETHLVMAHWSRAADGRWWRREVLRIELAGRVVASKTPWCLQDWTGDDPPPGAFLDVKSGTKARLPS